MVRIKSRYFLVNIIYPNGYGESQSAAALAPSDIMLYNQPTANNLNWSALLRGIRAQVTTLFGDYGSGTAETLQVKYLSTATSTFILKVSRAHYRLVWAALTVMNKVPTSNGRPCVFRVVRVSGTIRKIENEAIRRSRLLIHAAKEEMGGRSSDALQALLGGRDGDVDMADMPDGHELEDGGVSEGD